MEYILIIYTFIIAAAFQIWVHEACHAVMGKVLVPASLVTFKPWPHVFNGSFYLGRMELRHDYAYTDLQHCYILAAPLLGALTLLFVYALLGGCFLCAAVAPMLDIAHWFVRIQTKSTHEDGYRFMQHWRNKDA